MYIIGAAGSQEPMLRRVGTILHRVTGRQQTLCSPGYCSSHILDLRRPRQAGEVHPLCPQDQKAGAQVAQDLSSREVSSVQSLRDAWTYQTGYTPRGCCGSTTGGTFTPRGTWLGEHKEGRGLTSQNQEGREVRFP